MASKASALHKQGQKLYQRGDFKAAVEAFGDVGPSTLTQKGSPLIIHQALNQKDADSIGILDNRAATFCKLEDFDKGAPRFKTYDQKGQSR